MAQKRKDVVLARAQWAENQSKNIDKASTYWFDESSVNCGMTRLYARALSGERVNDYVPDVRFERTSVMGALSQTSIVAPFIFKGTLDSTLFQAYVEQVLTKTLKRGDTFILDNSSVHTVKNIMQPIIDMGVNVVFLPKYSPDLNPIELAWSKMKTYLRKVKARDIQSLTKAINDALNTITQNDIEAWVKHCGYA